MIATDIIAAARMWRRQPGVPLAVVFFLAVGLGAATSVFAVSDAVLWRSWPIPEPGRVVWVQSVDRGTAGDTSPGAMAAWQARSRAFTAIGAMRPVQATLDDDLGAERVTGVQASPGVFEALAAPPAIGRGIEPEDASAGAAPVLVLSHRLWRARYAATPAIVGQIVEVDGRPRAVIGVAAAALDSLPFGGELWVPLTIDPAASPTGPRYLDVVARLRDEIPPDAGAADLSAINAAVGSTGDTGVPLDVRVTPLGDAFTAAATRVLYPMLAAMAIVLLMGVVNAATLIMAHGHRRRGELAVRAALGASRPALVRQLTVESTVMVLVASGAGLVLAQWITAGLKATLPAGLPRLAEAAIDLRAALFLAIASMAVSAGIGITTAARHAGASISGEALAGARGAVRGPERWRAVFVAVQVGLAVTMAAAGVAAVQTIRSLSAVPPGYRGGGVLTAAVRLPPDDFPSGDAVRRTIAALVAAAEARPEVARAAMTTRVPLSGGAPGSDLALATDDFDPGVDRQVRIRFVTPSFFAVVGTRIVAGRSFAPSDVAGAPRVVMVNETLARRLSKAGAAVGESVVFAVPEFNPEPRTPWQVIGVAADARDRGPRDDVEPEVYVTMAQGPAAVFDWIGRQVLLVVRGEDDREVPRPLLAELVRGVDPRLAPFDVMTLDDRLRRHLATERLLALLLAPLGVAGLALTGFGIWALVAQVIMSRRREIALRLVLGATPARLLADAASQGIRLAGLGALLGLGGAMAIDRMLAGAAFGAGAADPWHLAAVGAAVAAIALIAIWMPTRRTMRQDPGQVLRAE